MAIANASRLLQGIGGLIARPRSALADVDRVGGGVAMALILVVAGAIAFRMPHLADAVRGASLGLGAVARVLSVLARELNGAIWVVLPAGLVIAIVAGERREPGADFELGAACYIPFFAIEAPFRAGTALGVSLPAGVLKGAHWVALACAGATCILAILQTRTRPVRRQAPGDVPVSASLAAASPSSDPARGAGSTAVRIAAAAALAAFLVAGLAGGALTATRPRPAVAFTLPRADGAGGLLALDSLRGRVVLLDFWATWCPPCLEMLPTIKSLHEAWSSRGVEIVGINSDGADTDPAAVRAFISREGVPYRVVIDDGRAAMHYGVTALPHLVLIGRDGLVKQTFWGATTKPELERALSREVGQP